MRSTFCCFLLLLAAPGFAQESQFHADVRREGTDIGESCASGFDVKKIAGCVITLATDDPLHVAVGSLAPQNGMGVGLAFVEHYTPNERWRLGWNADGVVAAGGSYRAGLYMKIIHTATAPTGGIVIRRPGTTPEPPTRPATVTIHEYPVFNLYAQSSALETLTIDAGQSPFSETQTILGANVIYPLTQLRAMQSWRLSLVGTVNGRFVRIHNSAVSLNQQRSFAQFEEGIRLTPSVFDDRLRLNYLASVQQFTASADSQASFHRWTLDLRHEFPLYRTVSSSGPKDTNGPDECFQSVGSTGCPPVSYSRNLEGSISVRALAIRSLAGSNNSVPFYFQPTLGGSDINGQRLLSAYDDYQFRGPNLVALQEGVEHSVWGPIGVYVLAEQGQVTAEGDGLGFGDLLHSVAVGLTLRAGGFPLVNLSFAWGGGSHHIVSTIDPTLLGGSARPSLY